MQGLYLHGSVALGDCRPGRSDIGFLTLTPSRPSDDEINTLATVHKEMDRLHPRPHFHGLYLTRPDLADGPDDCPDVPGCLEATFDPRSRNGLVPVTWHELAVSGVTVRGPSIATPQLWNDQEALLSFTRDNLQTYWRGWIGQLDRLAELKPEKAVDPWFVEWCVLGVVRLHALLVTGRLHSKGSAGRFALEALDPKWHPIVAEALRIRDGDNGPSMYADPWDRYWATQAFVAELVGANND